MGNVVTEEVQTKTKECDLEMAEFNRRITALKRIEAEKKEESAEEVFQQMYPGLLDQFKLLLQQGYAFKAEYSFTDCPNLDLEMPFPSQLSKIKVYLVDNEIFVGLYSFHGFTKCRLGNDNNIRKILEIFIEYRTHLSWKINWKKL